MANSTKCKTLSSYRFGQREQLQAEWRLLAVDLTTREYKKASLALDFNKELRPFAAVFSIRTRKRRQKKKKRSAWVKTLKKLDAESESLLSAKAPLKLTIFHCLNSVCEWGIRQRERVNEYAAKNKTLQKLLHSTYWLISQVGKLETKVKKSRDINWAA